MYPSMPFLSGVLLLILTFSRTSVASFLSSATLHRRTLSRFTVGHKDNELCWDRNGVDGWISPVDSHNHFRPFKGPTVEFEDYTNWMKEHGILFSTAMGLGQQLHKQNHNDPECCYYLHCPTYDYPVKPDKYNDEKNAQDYTNHYKTNDTKKSELYLVMSTTFANLQNPENNMNTLNHLTTTYPDVFGWAGEINVFKHALAANAFFKDNSRITTTHINTGRLDDFFNKIIEYKWPITLHCDLGCDNYDALPDDMPVSCEVPAGELTQATDDYEWYQGILGPYYAGFFDTTTNVPKENFKKIQHLPVWDAILARYPDMKVVWAHLGLSKELLHLHPFVHTHIMGELFKRHKNFHADISWDILSKIYFLTYSNATHGNKIKDGLRPGNHQDMPSDADWDIAAADGLRNELHAATWLRHQAVVHSSGTKVLGGPTHHLAIYLNMFHEWSDRFVTGTDYVASLGPADQYPGLRKYKKVASGCMKNIANHARQLTDTSAVNMFLEDEAFTKIVLGENWFRINDLASTYKPPPICQHEVKKSGIGMPIAIGVGVGAGVVTAIVLILIAVCIWALCCRGNSKSGAPHEMKTMMNEET